MRYIAFPVPQEDSRSSIAIFKFQTLIYLSENTENLLTFQDSGRWAWFWVLRSKWLGLKLYRQQWKEGSTPERTFQHHICVYPFATWYCNFFLLSIPGTVYQFIWWLRGVHHYVERRETFKSFKLPPRYQPIWTIYIPFEIPWLIYISEMQDSV